MWFDFATGKNGNVFDFVMATENVSLNDAVKRLAEFAGMPLPVSPGVAEAGDKTKRTDLTVWLQRQSYQVSIAYTARAALRSLPQLAMALGPRGGGARGVGAAILLPSF
jgi:DNA primase